MWASWVQTKKGLLISKKKSVAIIFPTYNEQENIRRAIEDFDASGYVDEIIVVDNNSTDDTRKEVAKTRAKLVREPMQGYGHAIRKGIKTAKSDLLIICEPDGTFDGRDVVKLLAYSDNFDVVFGSRTHKPLIEKDSDMTLFKRIGDVMLAKIVNVLFLKYPITDIGCTFRLTNRKGWKQVVNECKASDGMLATEWVLVAAKNNVRYIEVPINFRARVGYSTVSGTLVKKINWGIRKFFYILKVWVYWRADKKLYH